MSNYMLLTLGITLPNLTLPKDFALPQLVTAVAPGDTMFDGREGQYLEVGLSALNVVEAALHGAAQIRSILDLPCGYGRVTRMLRARYPRAAMTVCDLDRDAVDFSASTFGATGVYSTPEFRDLRLDGHFDLIWVGSLLTHLPEHQTRQFLDLVTRHMDANSRLIVTSHGEHVATRLRVSDYGVGKPAARGLVTDYLANGYAYRGYDGSESYGISLAARAWFETLLNGSELRLQSFYERGWDRHQDVLVLRKVDATRGGLKRNRSRPVFSDPSVALPLQPAEQAFRDMQSITGFDEAWYLGEFSDVAAAHLSGTYSSGLAHYLAYGWKEGRLPCDPKQLYANRCPPQPGAWVNNAVGGASRVNEAWSVRPEDQAEDLGWYWMAHPAVRARSNTLASGDPAQDAYDHLTTLLTERGWTLPIPRALSIGCGFGALERDLSGRGIIREIDGYDIASSAIAEAERQARRLGLLRVRYHVADLETIDLPAGSVDAVFAHSSVHHVERLEALYSVVQRALRPGGVFHLHEYVGPTRFQWTDAQLELGNLFLDSLPPRLRLQTNGEPKPRLRRPTVDEMLASDPSESVRSAELVAALEPCFEIIDHRPLGGAIAHIALGGIAQNFDPMSIEDAAILQRLFAIEDTAMAEGVVGSDFATITAVPKSHPRAASLRQKVVFSMPSTIAARAAALFPPARRVHDAILSLNASVEALKTHQERLTDELATLRAQQTTVAPAPAVEITPVIIDPDAVLDRNTKRELGEAALRCLPFLPGEFEVRQDLITVTGYCGAPDGLTQNMAFFVNGKKINDVDYPIEDPELKSRFPDVSGMGFVFRARIREGLEALHALSFWRFDASPTGHYNHADWRRAIHYMNPARERFPLPPTLNIKRVIGDTSVERFSMGGAMIFNNAAAYLREIGRSWDDFPNVLDWGCGAGRLTRYLIGETDCSVTGADIDADNIAWCQNNYSGGAFQVVPLRPPTQLQDGQFDLVFGLSVLTHLQEQDQFLWLRELERITKPGALLFLSVQGPTQFSYNKFPPHLYRKLQVQGYIDFCRDAALDDVVSDIEYYRAAMHSRPYIIQRWGEFFEIVSIVDAIGGLQDFVVLRRR